jgi:hypothetical protein
MKEVAKTAVIALAVVIIYDKFLKNKIMAGK